MKVKRQITLEADEVVSLVVKHLKALGLVPPDARVGWDTMFDANPLYLVGSAVSGTLRCINCSWEVETDTEEPSRFAVDPERRQELLSRLKDKPIVFDDTAG